MGGLNLYILHDRRSPPHTPYLRSGYNSMRIASSQILQFVTKRRVSATNLVIKIFTTTPPPPYPNEGYLPTPRPPPDIGMGLNRSYSSLFH